MDLKKIIRDIPDFPKPGVMFRDITTLLKNPDALVYSVDELAGLLSGMEFDTILGPESRGFIFGVPIAYKLRKGFVPVRKAGKLPFKTIKREYELEYGTAEIEIHRDALTKNDRVVVVDDLLATGGTAKAIAELVRDEGCEVLAFVFLIELSELGGRETLTGYTVKSLLTY